MTLKDLLSPTHHLTKILPKGLLGRRSEWRTYSTSGIHTRIGFLTEDSYVIPFSLPTVKVLIQYFLIESRTTVRENRRVNKRDYFGGWYHIRRDTFPGVPFFDSRRRSVVDRSLTLEVRLLESPWLRSVVVHSLDPSPRKGVYSELYWYWGQFWT